MHLGSYKMISVLEIFCNHDFSGCFTILLLLHSSSHALPWEDAYSSEHTAVWLQLVVVPRPPSSLGTWPLQGAGLGQWRGGLGHLSKVPLSDSHSAANTPPPSMVRGTLGTQPHSIGSSGFTPSASILELPQPRSSQLSPCLNSHFLLGVKGCTWGLTPDRGQVKTEDLH